MTKLSNFRIVKSAVDSSNLLELTPQTFDKIFRSGSKSIERIRMTMESLTIGSTEWAEAKKRLPALIWQGRPRTADCTHRKKDDMVPTGMLMLDIDHPSVDPRELWQQEVQPKLLAEKVRLVYISPGGGLKILCENDTGLPLKQAIPAKAAGFGEISKACSDNCVGTVDRINFVPLSPEDVLFLDEEWFATDDMPLPPSEIMPSSKSVHKTTACKGNAAAALSVDALLYAEEQYIINDLGYDDGILPEGERNNGLFRVLTNIATVVDDEHALADLEFFGLPDAEVDALIASACASKNDKPSQTIKMYLDDWKTINTPALIEDADDEEDDDADDNETENALTTPALPYGSLPQPIQTLLNVVADYQKPAALAGILSCLSALGRYECESLEGTQNVVNLQVSVTGKAGAGKGGLVLIHKLLFEDQLKHEVDILNAKEFMKDREAAAELKADDPAEYKRLYALSKQTQRLLAGTLSKNMLIQRLSEAGLRSVHYFASEMDSVPHTGTFMNITELLRVAFEGESYMHQSCSSQSKNVSIPRLRLSTLFLGTEDAAARLYPTNAILNGTVSRVWFSRIEESTLEDLHYTLPDSTQMDEIRKMVAKLEGIGSDTAVAVIRLPQTIALLKARVAEARKQSMYSQDPRDGKRYEYIKRCASIALRSACVISAIISDDISNPVDDERIHRIAEYVLDASLNELLRRYLHISADTEIIAQQDKNQRRAARKATDTYALLPATFTKAELKTAMATNNAGKSPTDVAARQVLYRWRQAGLIKSSCDKGKYEKITQIRA